MGNGICVSNVFDIMYINFKLFILRWFFENSFFYLIKSYYLLKLKKIGDFFINYI